MIERSSFHGKVILLIAIFVIYIGLELSVNLLLIDVYSKPLSIIFGSYEYAANKLELFGRVLTGFGLALTFISFIPVDKLPLKKAKWVVKPLVFMLMWLMIIPTLRLVVDGFIHNTTNVDKLSAVRAIVYKEGYLANRLAIKDFDEFNAIAKDPERKDLVVALIPSLAYFSSSFNGLIERNTESIAEAFLSNKQSQKFTQDGLPLLRKFDALYKGELQQYKTADVSYAVALNKLKDKEAITAEKNSLITSVNSGVQNHWNSYISQFELAGNFLDDIAKNQSLREAHHKFKDRYRSSRCDTQCRGNVNQEHANYFNHITYENGRGLGVHVLPEHIFYSVLGTQERIELMLEKGRKHWLKLVYGVDEEENIEQYIASGNARKFAIKHLKEKGIVVPDTWQFSDTMIIEQKIISRYQKQADTVWITYRKNSQFDISDIGLDRFGFATHPVVEKHARATLRQFYIEDFSPGLPEKPYLDKWLAQQNNISFIRMVTSTAATAAFSPGGVLYDIGNDAVKLSVIPPLSIGLSFLAIFLLFGKLGYYLVRSNSYGYFAIVVIAVGLIFILPTYQSVSNPNSYHKMMAAFSQEFQKGNDKEQKKSSAFGYALDLENGLFANYKDLPFVKSVGQELGIGSKQGSRQNNLSETEEYSSYERNSFIRGLRAYDNAFYHVFDWIPAKFNTGNIVQAFDANVTILKRDQTIGAFLGVYFDGEKVKEVKMPNFL
ncbi:hypothetical protein H4J42_13020, partial [Colwellia sp. BRX8-8]|nr:hypothetical protein [Colwellia sp. BRX8-8]